MTKIVLAEKFQAMNLGKLQKMLKEHYTSLCLSVANGSAVDDINSYIFFKFK